jgi:hypothetical protein
LSTSAFTLQPSLADIVAGVLRGEHRRAAYPIDEFAAIAGGIASGTVRNLYYDGKLRGLKIAGKLMIPASEVDRFLAESETQYMPATSGIGVIAPTLNRRRAAERRRREAAARKAAASSPKKVRTARAS